LSCLLSSRAFGISLLNPEAPGWFPDDELRQHYDLPEHKLTWAERHIFGIREDGTEGIFFPTGRTDNIIHPPPVIPTISADDDDNKKQSETKA
jgi:hypothetical protein